MKTIILLITVLLANCVYSQDNAKEILANYVRNLGQLELPEEGKTYYLNMTIKNEYHAKVEGPAQFNIEAYLTRNQLRYNANYLTIFQDTTEVLAVIHSNKQIYLSDANPKSKTEEQRKRLTGVQLELIKTGKIISVEKDLVNPNLQKITLLPQTQFGKNTGVKQLIFQYNNKKERITAVKIIYDENQKIKSQEFSYNSFDLNYKAGNEIPVRDYIFKKSGKLLDKYQGYQIIDNRS